MRIGVTITAAKGHLYPMTTLARKLQSRGHEVICFGPPDAAKEIEYAGLRFEEVYGERFPLGSFAAKIGELSKLSGQNAAIYTTQWMHEGCRIELEELPTLLQRIQIDGLVVDRICLGAGIVAMAMHIPFVHVSVTPLLDLSGITPLWWFSCPHEDSEAAQERNRKDVTEYLYFEREIRSTMLEYLEKRGVTVNANDIHWPESKLAYLTQIPQVFDFPGEHLPKHFHRTGPFQDGARREPAAFPWEKLTGEPLIYASLGTQTSLEDVFQKILGAVERPGHQLVMSVGTNIKPDILKTKQANTIILQHAPQFELLKFAKLCVTHAGANTTLDALMQGVPLVAIPIAQDQPGIAARILASGIGLFIPVEQLTTTDLRKLVDEVLGDPSYQKRAQEMKIEMASIDGLGMASELIERAFK